MSRRCGAPIIKIRKRLTFKRSNSISDNFLTKLNHDSKNAQNFVESECIIIIKPKEKLRSIFQEKKKYIKQNILLKKAV